jgi:hypothetical protein
VGVVVAEQLGRAGEQRPQQCQTVVVQQGRAARAGVVRQVARPVAARVHRQPIVDRLPAHAEQAGDFGQGASAVELQQRQRATVDSGIQGLLELPLQPAALRPGEFRMAHNTFLRRLT